MKTSRLTEIILNGFSILFSAIIVAVIFSKLLEAPSASTQIPKDDKNNEFVGRSMGALVPEHSWNASVPTVVLALRSTCVYCQQSVGFHRELLRLSDEGLFGMMVVSEEPSVIMHQTLKAEALDIKEIYQVELDRLGVVGTPTLFLVDAHGRITGAWQGLLTADREQSVATKLGARDFFAADLRSNREPTGLSPLSVPYYPAELIGSLDHPQRETYILDIRSRKEFEKAHIRGAINIPEDELEMRVPHELSAGSNVAVFCQHNSSCESSYQTRGLFTNCSLGVMLLEKLGLRASLLPELDVVANSGGTVVQR